MKNTKQCITCKTDFVITVDRTMFCSHRCQAKWAIKKAALKRKPRPKTGRTLICISCSKEFYVPKYRLKKGNAKYCSRSCLAKIHLAQFSDHWWKSTGKPRHTYKYITVNGKQYREHRHIMEQHLGRKLEHWEHIHHINDNSLDNRLENLEVLSNSEHQKKEHAFRKKLIQASCD